MRIEVVARSELNCFIDQKAKILAYPASATFLPKYFAAKNLTPRVVDNNREKLWCCISHLLTTCRDLYNFLGPSSQRLSSIDDL